MLLQMALLVRQHCQVAHGGAAMWAVEGSLQLCKAGQDAALLLACEGAADHDGGAAGTAGQYITHPAVTHNGNSSSSLSTISMQ
jgi:hypothetical protein